MNANVPPQTYIRQQQRNKNSAPGAYPKWDQHNTDFVSEYMSSQGYQPGKGLGKRSDGITTPVKPSKTTFIPQKPFVMYVGTSMIGGVTDQKLQNKTNERVKVHSHPGATIQAIKYHLQAHLM